MQPWLGLGLMMLGGLMVAVCVVRCYVLLRSTRLRMSIAKMKVHTVARMMSSAQAVHVARMAASPKAKKNLQARLSLDGLGSHWK